MVVESVPAERPLRTRKPRARRRWLARVLTIGAILGIGLGVATVAVTAMYPEQAEHVYGAVQRDVGAFRLEVLGEVPEVILGASGGMTELDRCDGTFTEMRSYEHDDVPPVWAAHNNCGGDVTLPWEIGQQVRVVHAGVEQLYVVTDIRITPKTWATVDDLLGLGGEFGLQTCFYGENRMKFVGLELSQNQ